MNCKKQDDFIMDLMNFKTNVLRNIEKIDDIELKELKGLSLDLSITLLSLECERKAKK